MRRNKFRYWYGGKMIDVVKIEFFTDGSCVVNDELIGGKLIEFTGLLDKNGKEIYEGDIVRVLWSGKLAAIYQIMWIEAANGFRLTRKKKDMYRYCGLFLSNAPISEVIGNIYENPDLLK